MADSGLELIGLLIEIVVDVAYALGPDNKGTSYKRKKSFYNSTPIKRSNNKSYMERDKESFKERVTKTPNGYRNENKETFPNNLDKKEETRINNVIEKAYNNKPEEEIRIDNVIKNAYQKEPVVKETIVAKTTHQSVTQTFGLNVQRVKLEILMLGYIYLEDDGKVSSKEKREIKKHFSKYKNKLTNEELSEIRSLAGMDSSLMNMRALISQNEVSDTDITRAISVVREINRGENKYSDIIKRVERALLESMGY